MKNIFVTGATGFLGQTLCSQLKKSENRVLGIDSKMCNLTQQGSLSRYDNEKFDEIFHLAAWTQAGDFCLYHPGEQWVKNQQINTNVFEWWQRKQPQAKLVFMGTSCSYDPDLPLKEENYMLGTPIDSLFTYAMTKQMMYAGSLALNKQYGLKFLCCVPSTLYGSNYHTDGRQMHFIFDLIRKIIRAKYKGERVVLWGDGFQSRELVLVDDFVEIMLKLNETEENTIINIGAGEEYTIRYFAKLICQEVDYAFDSIEFDTSKYVGAKSKCLDISKLRKLLPSFSYTSLEYGLKTTINDFLNNKEKILEL